MSMSRYKPLLIRGKRESGRTELGAAILRHRANLGGHFIYASSLGRAEDLKRLPDAERRQICITNPEEGGRPWPTDYISEFPSPQRLTVLWDDVEIWVPRPSEAFKEVALRGVSQVWIVRSNSAAEESLQTDCEMISFYTYRNASRFAWADPVTGTVVDVERAPVGL